MSENTDEFREKFNDKVLKLLSDHPSDRAIAITRERYEQLICEVKEARRLKETKRPLTTKQYRRLKRYDLAMTSGETERLVENKKNVATIRYFCHVEELFDILHEVHVTSGHKRTQVMETEIKKNYCNITREIINIYLSLCETCIQKKQESKRNLILKPMMMNSCCIVDIIDMQTDPDGQYRFLLNYQDHLTKFIVLRALKTNSPQDVAHELMDIFCIFGTPCILRTSDGTFAMAVVETLAKMKHGVRLVHGSPKNSHARFNQELRVAILNWMSDESSTNWSQGLRFVQCNRNRCYNEGIRGTPYEAMFGNMQRIGLRDSPLPAQVCRTLQTEEDLEKAIEIWNKKSEDSVQSESSGLAADSKRKLDGRTGSPSTPPPLQHNKRLKDGQLGLLCVPELSTDTEEEGGAALRQFAQYFRKSTDTMSALQYSTRCGMLSNSHNTI